MPEFSKRIEIEGKYFTWDEENDEVYEVSLKFTPVDSEAKQSIKKLIQIKRKTKEQRDA